MYLFALSTAEQGAGMALFEHGELVFESSLFTRQTHSKGLLVMIQQAIGSQAGLLVDQIDGFIAARGPGSFTGLRIGISMIKGLAKAASKPCAGASSLDGIAFRFSCADLPVCVMMDAKRSEVYTALYQFHGGILVEKSRETVCPPEAAIDLAGPDALYVGSGSKAYQELICDRTHGKAVFSHASADSVSAAALVRSVMTEDNRVDFNSHPLTPVYLRKSDAQIYSSEKTGA